MSTGNNVTIVGSLGRDPELRFTPTGQAVATFSVAVNRRWQNRQTQAWEESTDWIDTVAWGQLAENVAESLTKGARVIVSGRFQTRQWETADGDKRSKVEIVADDIGPSLKWATATVTRNERKEGGDYDRNSASPTPTSGPAAAAPARTQWDVDPNEEPFVADVHDWLPGAWGTYPERML